MAKKHPQWDDPRLPTPVQAFNGIGEAQSETTLLPDSCQEALAHLWETIAAGETWPLALLEAIGLWTLPEEVYKGRLQRYLIHGEAFDWLLLARRLTDTVDSLIPALGQECLIRQGCLPQEVSGEEFKRRIGTSKYQAYLNYWYGVTVEDALQEAVRGEVRKERVSRGLSPRSQVTGEAFSHIYGESRVLLMEQFLLDLEKPASPLASGELAKEFTYWLFKLRLRRCDPARVASDTQKALRWLQRYRPEAFLWQVTLSGPETKVPPPTPGTTVSQK